MSTNLIGFIGITPGTTSVVRVMAHVYVLHENAEWLPPLAEAFEAAGLPWVDWHLDEGVVDLDEAPPEGVFYSRMSASAPSRGHAWAKDYTRSVLSWLESHDRTVVNGRRVIELEMSKVDQHAALRAGGFDVPRTIAVVGTADLSAQARRLDPPFITKHNQGGKGLGVRRFDSHVAFDDYVSGPAFEPPADGITLLQEYLEAARPIITRVEIVGGRFLYALTADTSDGFDLCPADECAVDGELGPTADAGRFHWREGFDHPVIDRYLRFAERWGIGIAGFEFIETRDGRLVTYDINTNTNYNAVVEREAGRSGPAEIARYLGELMRVEARAAA